MLLYRPLLTAYRQAQLLPVRRHLLREFARPRLHAEPDEVLDDLREVREVSLVTVPERLHAEVSLRERLLLLRLTTGDTARQSGGIWTYHAQHRAVVSWTRSGTPSHEMTRAAGNWLGPVALSLIANAGGAARAEALAALGDLGEDLAVGTLAGELSSGAMPEAAAVGLARMGGAAAAQAIEPAVHARGLSKCASWLGVALRGLAVPEHFPLLERMIAAPEPEVREAAAWALAAHNPKTVRPLVEQLKWETDSFVRLNLLASLARLHLQGSLEIVRSFYNADETEIVRTAAIRAAGALTDAEAPLFLESVLRTGSPVERAEALQALVTLQVPGDPYLPEARRAANSTSGRLKLLGLLAKVVWAPQEALERVRLMFSGAPTGDWFLATYVLRYLKTDSAVRLLKRICEASRGSELEEIAVDALARHMDRPGVVEFLLNIVKQGARPVVLERIMQDLARHLPAEDAMAGAHEVRQLLDRAKDPVTAGPLLAALGALGGPDDANRMLPFLEGDAAPFAIRGLELLMAEPALPHLEKLAARSESPAAGAAVTALFRLGHAGAPEALEKLAESPDGLPRASRALLDDVLSVRHVRAARRLALLYAALQDRAKAKAGAAASNPQFRHEESDPSVPDIRKHLAMSGQVIPGEAKSARSRQDFLELLDRPGDNQPALPLPRLTHVPPAGSGPRVYEELGQHLIGRPKDVGISWRVFGAALAILIAAVVLIANYVRGTLG